MWAWLDAWIFYGEGYDARKLMGIWDKSFCFYISHGSFNQSQLFKFLLMHTDSRLILDYLRLNDYL